MIRARHALLLAPMLLLVPAAPSAIAKAKPKARKAPAAHIAAVAPACTDYYDYANAAWLKANPAPEAGAISALGILRAKARDDERTLLDSLSHSATDDSGRALGTLWSEGMNTAAVDAAGVTPLQATFARIAAIRKNKDLPAAIADLHAAGIPVLFRIAADGDARDPDLRIAYLSQGGLGLPDPAFYTRTDAETRDVLGRYRTYVQAILQATGTPADQVSVQSGWVISMEMELAQHSQGLAQQNDPGNSYRSLSAADLQKAYPHFELAKFLKAQGVKDAPVSLSQTDFFDAADGMLANTPVEQWQAYLRFHAASAMAPYLSAPLRDAHFQMYDRLLAGLAQAGDRAQQVQYAIDHALPAQMGHAFAQRYLTPATKQAATAVADAMRDAMKKAIAGNPWMDDATRAAAQSKLDKLRIEIGEPAQAPTVTGLKLGQGYGADMLAVAGWQHRQEMATIGQRSTDRPWRVPPQVPDISYSLLGNRLIVTAAILRAPVFDDGMNAARRFGALGTLIGHQLHNAIAGKGRSVDATGQLRDWWSPQATSAFEQRTSPIIAQYDAYTVDAAKRVDGSRTRDENLADLGGLELALQAFTASQPSGKAATTAEDRDFFDAYAGLWARSTASEVAAAWAASAVQAPAKYRVNGVLANTAEFARTHACKAGEPMAIKAGVTIWR
ncbi:MAG: M13 family metallopeptidase [Proteobacteria bacterium]|nr:M13 family metallopeptidase [Pseudomonadota bacterium]